PGYCASRESPGCRQGRAVVECLRGKRESVRVPVQRCPGHAQFDSLRTISDVLSARRGEMSYCCIVAQLSSQASIGSDGWPLSGRAEVSASSAASAPMPHLEQVDHFWHP